MADNHKTCFYCDGLVAERTGKGDHFPIPARHGGTETVDVCISCHDAKDRFRLDNWHVSWIAKVIADFPSLSRESRIFLAKCIALMMDATESNRR